MRKVGRKILDGLLYLVRCPGKIMDLLERHAVLVVIVGLALMVFLFFKLETFARKNCEGLTDLAGIQTRYIAKQETQTQGLLAKGVTFGIPKAELPFLIEQSRQNEAVFLNELRDLAHRNCE